MQSNTRPDPVILIDWGTSRLRAFLYREGVVLARIDGPGIGALNSPPRRVLQEAIGPWLRMHAGTRVYICGMGGSRNGILEVPYVSAPTSVATWRCGAARLHEGGTEIIVAAGLRGENLVGAPDVMRGEETQIFGALNLHTEFARGRHVFVLPGTHSKWAMLDDGTVTCLHTAFTGELYELLLSHSILMKVGSPPGDASGGFEAGLARAATSPAGLLGSLFEARSAQLVLDRSHNWAQAFLSGLLIGTEVMQMAAGFGQPAAVVLVGSPDLCARYYQALMRYDTRARILDGDDCAIGGLLALSTPDHGGRRDDN